MNVGGIVCPAKDHGPAITGVHNVSIPISPRNILDAAASWEENGRHRQIPRHHVAGLRDLAVERCLQVGDIRDRMHMRARRERRRLVDDRVPVAANAWRACRARRPRRPAWRAWRALVPLWPLDSLVALVSLVSLVSL